MDQEHPKIPEIWLSVAYVGAGLAQIPPWDRASAHISYCDKLQDYQPKSNPFDQDEEVAGMRSLKNILRQFGLAVIIGDRYDLMVPIIDSLGGKESHGQIANELRLHSGSPGELRTQGSANNSSMQ
ncbi:hypothetical protein FQN52_000090 [Onygenales sp. PD_12]|nr:hypothetical protein FQN52_000090 [Onygenales sp. PD_12]